MIAGIVLMARNPEALADFYCQALRFDRIDVGTLGLGAQRVHLVAASGAGYPQPRASNDPWFQHIAIVVTDIRTAYRRALDHGATPISIDGPRHLPKSSGGVTAWKFRDPEGHPLELLAFSLETCPDYWRDRRDDGLCIGIDHSAIVVADTARSIAFYAGFGFQATAHSTNRGAEQAALDGLADPLVAVTALTLPDRDPPHLELLEYCAPLTTRPRNPWEIDDVAATRLMLVDGESVLLRDPDGHFIQAVP
ncbi:VOC family protein [Acidiphilium iwatense]|uniref:VOC family protein n=2 Tax=Acidiphilium TaxID=522 RepID=A0ABS9DYR8_9PROT|nr:VOC family protein [Acidiphilium iwatense]MCF3947901.1 VOC family protein [Acidiphilium iwatense]